VWTVDGVDVIKFFPPMLRWVGSPKNSLYFMKDFGTCIANLVGSVLYTLKGDGNIVDKLIVDMNLRWFMKYVSR
jgi:hypothetical protein